MDENYAVKYMTLGHRLSTKWHYTDYGIKTFCGKTIRQHDKNEKKEDLSIVDCKQCMDRMRTEWVL